jgi:hypothetical protein
MHQLYVNVFGIIASILWFPFVILLIGMLGVRKGALATLVLGYLFLPHTRFDLPVVDYTKEHAVAFGLGMCYLASFFVPRPSHRPRLSLPALAVLGYVLCSWPSGASIGKPPYDFLVVTFNRALTIGIPFLAGRRFSADGDGPRALCHALILGALVYIFPCLVEEMFSPIFHRYVYGGFQHIVATESRYGGWRPMVFLQNGIAVAIYIGSAAFLATWLWRTGASRRLLGLPMAVIAVVLLVMTVLCKTLAALLLFASLGGALWCARLVRNRLPLVALMLVPPAYLLAPMTGYKPTDAMEALAARIDKDRLLSYQFRLMQEEMLIEKAKERSRLGWGDWGDHRILDEEGNDICTTDSLWIIEFGMHGVVGLVLVYLMLVLPLARFLWRFPPRTWERPDVATMLALAGLPALIALDGLVNDNLNPVILYIAGAADGFCARAGASQAKAKPAGEAGPPRPG